jgi:hypothetical protein
VANSFACMNTVPIFDGPRSNSPRAEPSQLNRLHTGRPFMPGSGRDVSKPRANDCNDPGSNFGHSLASRALTERHLARPSWSAPCRGINEHLERTHFAPVLVSTALIQDNARSANFKPASPDGKGKGECNRKPHSRRFEAENANDILALGVPNITGKRDGWRDSANFNGPAMDSICKQAEDRTPRMTVGLVKSAVKNKTITSFLLTSPEGKSISRLNRCEPETGQMLAIPYFRRQRAKRGVLARNLRLVEANHMVALTSVCNVQADPARDTGSIPVRSTNFNGRIAIKGWNLLTIPSSDFMPSLAVTALID